MWRKGKRDRIGWYCYWNICWNSYNAKHFASKANNVICQQLTPSLPNLPSFPPSFRSGKFSVVAQNFPRATNTIFPRKRETNLLVARKGDASTLPSSSFARHHLVEKEIDLREIVQRSFFSILFIYFFHEREHGRSDWLDDRRYEKSIILSSRLILFYGDYLSYRSVGIERLIRFREREGRIDSSRIK